MENSVETVENPLYHLFKTPQPWALRQTGIVENPADDAERRGDRMFFGEQCCTMDDKSRLSIPARFREELGEEFIITRWLDHCLIVLPVAGLEKIEATLADKGMVKTRDVRRFLYSGLAKVKPDKLGRVLVPAPLRAHAAIEKDAVVIGVGSYAEIWAPDEWERKQREDLGGLPILEAMEELDL